MRNVKIALAAGLGALLVALVLVLAQSPVEVIATSGNVDDSELSSTAKLHVSVCQSDERVPQGTKAVRLSMRAWTGSRVQVKLYSGSRVIASGEHNSGWSGRSVTVPVNGVSKTISPAKLCLVAGPLSEQLTLEGSKTSSATAAVAADGQKLAGRLFVSYIGAGHSSWLSLASSVVDHMALGRGFSGKWVVFFVLALMIAATALVSVVIQRELHE